MNLARAYGPDGAFLALVTYDLAAEVWRPHKVFCTRRPELVEGLAEGPDEGPVEGPERFL